MTLDFSFFTTHVISTFLVKGLIFSLKITLIAMCGGIIIGTLIAVMRLSKYKFLNIILLYTRKKIILR